MACAGPGISDKKIPAPARRCSKLSRTGAGHPYAADNPGAALFGLELAKEIKAQRGGHGGNNELWLSNGSEGG